jgi:AcrR family transcriptional regulator
VRDEGSEPRAEVLTAAITVFAARGVEGAGLAEIADEADVSLSALEQAFGTKEDLFHSAVREVARGHVARACAGLPPGPAVEQLRNFCGRGWEILHTPTWAALELLWATEIPRCPELARFYADEIYGPLHATLVGIIERGIAEGHFRPVAPRAAARVILAALVKQAFWCNHAGALGPAVGGGCNRVVAETLSILLGGLQPSRPDSTS